MREITRTDYKQFLQSHSEVEIGETKIKLHNNWKVHNFAPTTFTPETATVWSFPDRGDWATHVGNYRGNWSPYFPRNLILRYTAPGELVLDQPDYPSGAGIHVCLRGIRVCALPRRDSGWLAQGLQPWNASSWDGVPWGWTSTPTLSWWRATGWTFLMRRWMLSIKYRKSGHTWEMRARLT